jgi:hypothetical protein
MPEQNPPQPDLVQQLASLPDRFLLSPLRAIAYWFGKLEGKEFGLFDTYEPVLRYLAARHGLSAHGVGAMTLVEVAALLRRDFEARTRGQDPSAGAAPDTQRAICELLAQGPLKAQAITGKLGLSPEHVRRILAQMRRAGVLDNDQEGYRLRG